MQTPEIFDTPEPPIENNFLHMQQMMARSLKFWVQWSHQVQKKKKRRLFEILNPQLTRPHR